MNAKTKLRIRQLAIIMMAWVIFAVFMSVYDHLIIHSMNSIGPSYYYSFPYTLFSNCLSAVIGCLVGGSFLVFVINDKYDNKPFLHTVVVASGVYFAVIAVILMTITLMAFVRNQNSMSASVDLLRAFLTDESRIKNLLTWYVVVAITQVVLQLSKRFGEGNFLGIIKGDYNVAREEKKIFMFLDLNNSTTLAEELGDEKYHNMLRDFFSDISDEILNNRGRIYQYVGDEVVIQWDYLEGTNNDHCVKTFFDIKAKISRRAAYYLQRYGLTPTFKAGIHYGKVIAGEVGTVKREITYSGDVLNTTSRIVNMCSTLNTDLLVSSEFASILRSGRYGIQTHGAFALKGKNREVMLQSFFPLGMMPPSMRGDSDPRLNKLSSLGTQFQELERLLA